MSAPIDSRGLPTTLLKRITFCNSVVFVLIGILLFVPLNSKTYLDVVFNSLTAIKAWCLLLIVQNICCWFLVGPCQNINAKSSNLKLFPSLVRGVLVYLASVLLFHFIAVLYGAAFTENTAETFHFALLLSTCAIFPGILHLGTGTDSWIRVFPLHSPDAGMEGVVQLTTVFSIIGAWLGAFPIPLDWDRPWQVWPVSCVIGTLLGYQMGLAVSVAQLWLQHHKINKLKLT